METGITLEMVEQVYCMFRTQSFRLQVTPIQIDLSNNGVAHPTTDF